MGPSVIGTIATSVFSHSQESEVGDKVNVQLGHNPNEVISFPKLIWDTANSLPTNHQALKDVKIAMHLFKLEQFELPKLQKKIIKIVEKTTVFIPQQQTPSTKKSGNKENIDLKAAHLFKGAVQADSEATDKEVYLFIGATGSGKSTTMNYLHDCIMEKNSGKDIGANKPVIIARKPLSKIGFKGTTSTTSECRVVTDPKTKKTYVDCQGFQDTRGLSFVIYNAFSILEVIKKSQSVKGCLLFLEWPAIDSMNATGVETTLKSFFKLIKDFKAHEKAVLFVITKLNDPNITCENVKMLLIDKIKELSFTYQNLGDDFGTFCQQILDSQVLDGAFGERLVISDPLQPDAKKIILHEMDQFVSSNTKDFGYPITADVKNAFGETRQSFIVHAQNVLKKMIEEFQHKWEIEIADSTIEATKKWLDDLAQWLAEITPPMLKQFAEQKPYIDVSANATLQLKKCLDYWDKMALLDTPQHTFDELLITALESCKITLKDLHDKTEKLYYGRMFEVIQTDLEQCLHSYEGRKRVEKMKKIDNIKIVETCEHAELFQIIDALFLLDKKTFPYSDKFDEMMKKDENKSTTLKSLVKDNILQPLNSNVQIWGSKNFIQVTTHTPAISLSEILKEIEGSLKEARNISIHVKSPNGKLYLDQAMAYTNKSVTLLADQIIVITPIKIQLTHGTLMLKGELMGEANYDDTTDILHLSERKNTVSPIKKVVYWSW